MSAANDMKHGKTWTNQAEEQLVAFMILLIANNMCELAVVELVETTKFSVIVMILLITNMMC